MNFKAKALSEKIRESLHNDTAFNFPRIFNIEKCSRIILTDNVQSFQKTIIKLY